jgi:hypothetical protein
MIFSLCVLVLFLYFLDRHLPCHSFSSPQLFLSALSLFPLFIPLSLPHSNHLRVFTKTDYQHGHVPLSVRPQGKIPFRRTDFREVFKRHFYKNFRENSEDNMHAT